MELVDVEDITKDSVSLPPQSQWDAHTLRVHSIIVSLGGVQVVVNVQCQSIT